MSDVVGGSVAAEGDITRAVSDDLLSTWRDIAFNIRGGPLTYRRFTGETRNHKTGSVTAAFSNTLIALTLIGTTGSLESGKMTFKFRVRDMPEFPPSTQSRIVYRGKDWLIQSYTTDQSQKVCQVNCVRP